MSIKLGNTNIPFVFRGNEVIHPAPVKDGLVLWYDFSGRTNDDAQRDVAEDLSGNGNHGTLRNFNFTAESGYDKNHLLFDGVDDRLQIPELNLSENATTVQVGDKIYSYDGDKVVTIGEDGSVEVGGRNLLHNTSAEWQNANLNSSWYRQYTHPEVKLEVGETYTFSVVLEKNTEDDVPINVHIGTGTTSYQKDIRNWSMQNVPFNKKIVLTRTITEDDLGSHADSALFSWRVRNEQIQTSVSFKEVKLEKGDKATDWTPAPEDFIKKTSITHSPLRSLKYYNRPLTEEEIQHNYAIEK